MMVGDVVMIVAGTIQHQALRTCPPKSKAASLSVLCLPCLPWVGTLDALVLGRLKECKKQAGFPGFISQSPGFLVAWALKSLSPKSAKALNPNSTRQVFKICAASEEDHQHGHKIEATLAAL